MKTNIDFVRLVQQAQLGDKECLTRLAEAVNERLYSYVYRHTLAADLTQDIVQETILKMIEVLGELKEADRFWPWLFKIALSKIFTHRRAERQRRDMSKTIASTPGSQDDKQTAIANMVGQELREVVFSAMQGLKPRHRAVINMRCYDEMSYSEIARTMGCSEFAVQMSFYRAKKSLKKQLARNGFGKGSLLMALVLFGKMTAPSKAAAAEFTLTAAATTVGFPASAGAIATSKAAVVSLTTAGVLAVGTMVATSGNDQALVAHKQEMPTTPYVTTQVIQAGKNNAEHWYYYPPNGDGAVIMRFKYGSGSDQSYCQWLQNDQANYYKNNNAMYIRNSRAWADDLSVRRLPTDSPELTDFLSQVEGKTVPLEYVRHNDGGLLVIAMGDEDTGFSQIIHRYDASSEEYFRYNWQGKAKAVDQRDAMHKRGWTYFRIAGEINGKRITGTGRIPFVYATSRTHYPWLKLTAGQRIIREASFTGLCCPWMGLHTIDTVRRDAAEQRIWFETGVLPDGSKAEVTLTYNKNKLVYTIDMQADVVEKITFLSEAGELIGQLNFSYLQEVENIGNEFTSPREKDHVKTQGKLWLCELINLK